MLEEFIEVEQSEEERGVRDQDACDEVAADEPPENTNQEWKEREEGHVGAGVALRRDREVVHRIPASPHVEQLVGRLLHVRSRALTDRDGSEFGDHDDRGAGCDEIEQHFADRLIEACRDQHFADAKDSSAHDKDARLAVRDVQRQHKGEPQQHERRPRERVVA